MVDTDLELRENVAWIDTHHLIHTVFHGDQSPGKIRHTFEEIGRLCDEMAAESQPLLLLWDIRDVHDVPRESRMLALRARTQLPYWRIAIVGSSEPEHAATNISQRLTAMSGRKREIDYFTSLSDAYRWLDLLADRFNRERAEWPVAPS